MSKNQLPPKFLDPNTKINSNCQENYSLNLTKAISFNSYAK